MKLLECLPVCSAEYVENPLFARVRRGMCVQVITCKEESSQFYHATESVCSLPLSGILCIVSLIKVCK